MLKTLENQNYKKILKTITKNNKTKLEITAECIVIFLNDYDNKNGFFATCGSAIHFFPSNDFNQMYSICEWIKNKPLHEQTPETLEAIAKIIKK